MLLSLVLAIVFVLVIVRVLYELGGWLKRRPFVWVTDNQWAVVTGATDGIGYEFARQLAHKGYHLMLISRNANKLALTKRKILDDLNESRRDTTRIETLAVDFGRVDIYDVIDDFLGTQHRSIFVLVNNVGTAADLPNNFLSDNCGPRNEQIINTNLVSMTRMTELVLPSMVRHKRGLVVNVSSASSLYPSPMLDVYAATKSYMNKLNDCLAIQYANAGITFYKLIVYVVSTNMTHHIRDPLFAPHPRQFVQSALAAVKYRDSFTSTGYWPHTLIAVVFQCATLLVSRRIANKVWKVYYHSFKKYFGGDRNRSAMVTSKTMLDVLLNRN